MSYEEILKEIEEKGRETTVKIGDQVLKAKEYREYYVVQTNMGKRIFDGEHIIDPNFRVYDVNLKQYVYYDYPVEKLGKTFGVKIEAPAEGNTTLIGVMKLIDMILFLGALYLMFTNSGYTYYVFIAYGAYSIVEALVIKKETGELNKLSLIASIFIILLGLYGIFK